MTISGLPSNTISASSTTFLTEATATLAQERTLPLTHPIRLEAILITFQAVFTSGVTVVVCSNSISTRAEPQGTAAPPILARESPQLAADKAFPALHNNPSTTSPVEISPLFSSSSSLLYMLVVAGDFYLHFGIPLLLPPEK